MFAIWNKLLDRDKIKFIIYHETRMSLPGWLEYDHFNDYLLLVTPKNIESELKFYRPHIKEA